MERFRFYIAFFSLLLISYAGAVPPATFAQFKIMTTDSSLKLVTAHAALISCQQIIDNLEYPYYPIRQNNRIATIRDICGIDAVNVSLIPCIKGVCKIESNMHYDETLLVLHFDSADKSFVSEPFKLGKTFEYEVEINNEGKLIVRDVTPPFRDIFPAIIGIILFIVPFALLYLGIKSILRKDYWFAAIYVAGIVVFAIFFAIQILRG